MKIIEEKNKITRQEIQEKAYKLSLENPYMILEYPTGLGKSFTIIKIIERLLLNNLNYRCLILEPEIALIDNLQEEFKKFKKDNLLNQIDIVCYASLKNINFSYNILVLDEAHHAFSDLRLDYLKNLVPFATNIYLLSATLDKYQKNKIEYLTKKDFLVHKISLKNAIKWEILPKPKIGIFLLQLNNKEINCNYEYKRGKIKERKKIILNKENLKWKYIKDIKNFPHLHLVISCTEQQKYKQLCYEADCAKQKFLDSTVIDGVQVTELTEEMENLKKYWLYSELCIKRFLSERKTPYLDEFLNDVLLDKNRFIVFFGSVDQAEELAKKHNANLIASKNTNSQDLIKSFNDKKISNLYCCKMINEGVTLTDLEIGIIGQLDGQSRSFIQRLGRSLRSEYPQIYIFVYKDTKDENYLKKALTKINKEDIVYLNYFI